MADGKPVPGSVWFYGPIAAAPIVFSVLFGVSTALHLYQCFHYKSWRVTFYLPVCCALFTTGFALRSYGAYDNDNLPIYLTSTLLIYMSPPILELANYHILGRTFYYIPYISPLHPGRVLTTLGSLSAAVEALNALGVAYFATGATSTTARGRDNYTLGQSLLRASLALQLAVIVLFYTLAGVFHARCARAGVLKANVSGVLVTLYASMALILARTVYRGVEHFAAGGSVTSATDLSPVLRYEWFFWVFEAMPMLLNAGLWNARHPMRELPRSFRRYLAQDGVTELDGPGWGDKRSLVMTVVDPFGVVSLCEKERKGERFWEENGFHHLLGEKGDQGV